MSAIATWGVVLAVVLVGLGRHLLLELAATVAGRVRRMRARPEGVAARRRTGVEPHYRDWEVAGWLDAVDPPTPVHLARAAGGGARPAPRRAA